MEKKKKGRVKEKKRKGIALQSKPILIKNPRRAKENQKLLSSPQQKSKGLLEKSKKII